MRILKLFLVVGIIAFMATDVFAQSKGGTYPGMKVTQGIVCSLPHVAKDLMDVIENRAMFQTYENGYIISGYCSPVNLAPATMELKIKFPFDKVSHDGYRAEMWMVMVEVDEGKFEPRYAIIFPDAGNTIGGTGL